MILEGGEIAWLKHPGESRRCSQARVVGRHQIAKDETFLIFWQPGQRQLVSDLLATSLDGEIGLTEGNNRFVWISVLNDEVAGIA